MKTDKPGDLDSLDNRSETKGPEPPKFISSNPIGGSRQRAGNDLLNKEILSCYPLGERIKLKMKNLFTCSQPESFPFQIQRVDSS